MCIRDSRLGHFEASSTLNGISTPNITTVVSDKASAAADVGVLESIHSITMPSGEVSFSMFSPSSFGFQNTTEPDIVFLHLFKMT